MFVGRDPYYALRNNVLLQQSKFQTIKFGYKSFQYYGAKLWNTLPPDVKKSPNLEIFKRKLNVWLYTSQAASLVIM